MSQTKRLYKARLIGINAHQIKVLPEIESLLAEIPQDRSVYALSQLFKIFQAGERGLNR